MKKTLYTEHDELLDWIEANGELKYTTLFALTKLRIAWIDFKIAIGESILKL